MGSQPTTISTKLKESGISWLNSKRSWFPYLAVESWITKRGASQSRAILKIKPRKQLWIKHTNSSLERWKPRKKNTPKRGSSSYIGQLPSNNKSLDKTVILSSLRKRLRKKRIAITKSLQRNRSPSCVKRHTFHRVTLNTQKTPPFRLIKHNTKPLKRPHSMRVHWSRWKRQRRNADSWRTSWSTIERSTSQWSPCWRIKFQSFWQRSSP